MYQSTRYILVAVLYERLVKCGEKDVAQKNTVGHHSIIPLLMAILPRSAHSGAFLSDFSHCLQPVATDVISLLSVSFRGCQSFRSPSLSVSTGHLTLMAPRNFPTFSPASKLPGHDALRWAHQPSTRRHPPDHASRELYQPFEHYPQGCVNPTHAS